MKKGITGFFVTVFSLVALTVIGVMVVILNLPDVHALKGCLTTELYHVHLCKTDPNYAPYDQISHHIVDAIIMSEDASFYSHNGIDINEMKESLKRDLDEHRFARGASTITQQMVKNVFLSKDKSLLRKAQEIYLALQVEKVFSKQQILTFYLNVVEFGDGIYGVKAASRHYFNKTPAEVSPEQGAFLAFLLPNPKKYSQSFRKKTLTPFAARTINTILRRMQKSHRLSDEEFTVASSRVGPHLWSGDLDMPTTAAILGGAAEGSGGVGSADGTDLGESPMGQIPSEDQSDDDFKFQFDAEDEKPR